MPGAVVSASDQASRVSELEALVDLYKTELAGMSRDSREVEERLAEGAGLVKQSALQTAEAKVGQLERGKSFVQSMDRADLTDIQSLEATISQLTSANTTLDAEVNDLMRRVASGEYNPATERCIELKENPASRAMAVRTQMLEDLKAENKALLARLASADKGGAASDGSGEGMVPRSSYDRLVKEKEDLEKAHAKRLLRLKEVSEVCKNNGTYTDRRRSSATSRRSS